LQVDFFFSLTHGSNYAFQSVWKDAHSKSQASPKIQYCSEIQSLPDSTYDGITIKGLFKDSSPFFRSKQKFSREACGKKTFFT